VLRGGPDSLDPRQKAKLLAMAQSWISLADLAERNSHLDRIDETPPRRESPIHWGNWRLPLAGATTASRQLPRRRGEPAGAHDGRSPHPRTYERKSIGEGRRGDGAR
jgi:hypothetical protein